MKIFISWHHPRSKAIASALRSWMPRVIQAVKPFFSPEIEKGATWSTEMDRALEGTQFGIVCLTPDNLDSPWIHYETGALSKTGDGKIWTFLHGLQPSDVPYPLARFQHTLAEKDDIFKMVQSINKRLGDVGEESLPDQFLQEQFEMTWPILEKALEESEQTPLRGEQAAKGVGPVRDEKEVIGEVLEFLRDQNRRLATIEDRIIRATPPGDAHQSYKNDFYSEVTLRFSSEGVSNPDELIRPLNDRLQKAVPGTQVGLEAVRADQFWIKVHFPYPIDEDIVDDILHVAVQGLSARYSGYGSNPAWR